MIRLFQAEATTFETQGLGVLNAIHSTVIEERNGMYELEMEIAFLERHYPDIALGCLILSKPNPYDDPEPFRIYQISRPMNGIVTVNACHWSYDLSKYAVRPFTASSITAAMSALKTNSIDTCPFNFVTDKSVTGNFTVDKPRTIRSLLGGSAGSLLDVYGKGEWKFTGRTCYLYLNRGQDRGVAIRYGKNLTDLTQEENNAAVYSKLYPYWADSDGHLVTLPEYTLDINQNGNGILVYDMSDRWDSAPTVEQLRSAAQSYIDANDLDKPVVNLTLSFEQISELIKDAVYLCDTLSVEFPALGVSAKAKVIKTAYDDVLGRYTKIEIGTVKQTLAQTITTLQDNSVTGSVGKSVMQSAINSSTAQITGNNGGYIVWHDSNDDGKPDELLVMNTPSIATATKVWRFNQNGLGFSSTGYAGPYALAMTADGAIVADMITVGTLSATLMRAGILKSVNYDSSSGTAIAKNYTDSQVSGAISTAAADATSKANAAQAAAKSYTDTQISVIPGQIQSAISEIRVGGRNILKNSATKLFGLWSTAAANGGTMTTTDNVTVAAWGCTDAKRMTGKGGTTATVFAIMGGIYAPSSYSISGQAYTFSIFIKNDSAARILIVANGLGGSEYVAAGEAKRVVINTAVGNGTSAVQFNVCTNTSGADYDITYWHPQIEYGNTATDWSPAPEDTQVGGTNLLKDSESMASWSKGSSCTVSEGVATLAGTSSAWTALLSTSKYDAGLYDGTTEYICSFEYKSTAASDTLFVICATAASVSSTSYTRTKYTNWFPLVSLPSTGGKWVKYTLPARTISQAQLTDGSGDVVSGYLSMYARTDNVSIQVRLFKLEKGNRATDWSPAPDDIENDYNSKFNVVEQNLSTLTQTTSGISTEVSKKVNITTYNANNQAVSQQISNLSSRIDQTAGSIKGIVTQEISGLNAQSQSISNWFDFSVSNFLTIGQQGSAYKTQITNSAFNILHGNTTIGSFSATGLNTPSLTLETTFNLPPFVLQSISGGWILTEAS